MLTFRLNARLICTKEMFRCNKMLNGDVFDRSDLEKKRGVRWSRGSETWGTPLTSEIGLDFSGSPCWHELLYTHTHTLSVEAWCGVWAVFKDSMVWLVNWFLLLSHPKNKAFGFVIFFMFHNLWMKFWLDKYAFSVGWLLFYPGSL